ncbi:MAG: branched-chain amino acid ABC transporter permease [Pseudomonadota bacterium]|nr:branched-chain amino acid ABC transporter permease [Pseudomonadota bacterium]
MAAAPASTVAVAPLAEWRRPRRSGIGWLVPFIVLGLLVGVPFVAGEYLQDLIAKIVILAIFALSLELLVGTTGLVSLGHAAFLGIGAYAAVLGAPKTGAGSLLGLLALSMACAAAYALFVGALSLRTRGVYFIMVTLAFAQMAYFVFHDTKVGGGSDGIYLNVRPMLGSLIDLKNRNHFYGFALGSLVFTYALLAALLRSRFGHALAGIRINEQRMRAAGFRTYGYKLAAFVIGGALAGLAGFLIAARDGYVNPEMLAWQESGTVLLMLILGGLGHLRGAVLGAMAFTLLKELYSSQALVGPVADHWQLALGITIIVFVALLPKGLIGLPALLRRRRRVLAVPVDD